jgi:squalene-hopene/tetraprenyl-beta-curcumene cyclase
MEDNRVTSTQPFPVSPASCDDVIESNFSPIGGDEEIESSLQTAIHRTCRWLLDRQHADGYWCGELEGDTILESEYILLLAWLGRENSPVAQKAARYIVEKQLSGGGWAQYPGGGVDISGSVKAYFALKLTGHDPQADYMQRARAAILAHGGADAVNSFTRFYLALLGQISYEHCPAVPPEAVLLPTWSPLSIYQISAWSRTILVPLSIMWAHRPARQLAPQQGIAELFINDPDNWPELRCPGLKAARGWFTWERFFRTVDRTLKWCERRGLKPLRRRALRAAEAWMTERFVDSDGLGAIFPPIIWSVVALKCLGYDDDSAEVRYCHEQLESLMIEEDDTVRLEPCKSPVWDTAIALRSLAAAGLSIQDSAVSRAVQWLLDKEVTRRGDWSAKVKAEPGGWFFEHHNEFYPDVDDTIMVMMALAEGSGFRVQGSGGREQKSEVRGQRSEGWLGQSVAMPQRDEGPAWVAQEKASSLEAAREYAGVMDRVAAACERARRWILAMQNRDGGWGAFDKDNDHEFLCHVPFADHNAMIDPSTPDITARVLEALSRFGMRVGHPAVDRALKLLRQTQEPDGSWPGRWGVNYIYGTWQVLVGLADIGVPLDDPAIVRGTQWLVRHQQSSGGWGETANSYLDPTLRGQGPATASQTAWALLGLMAAGQSKHPAVERGVQFLIERQRPDGGWDEPEFTGTGFPLVFYLRYHLYPIYFPLLALAGKGSADRVQKDTTTDF